MNLTDRQIKHDCGLVLSRASAPPAAERLAVLAAHAEAEDAIDGYGTGGAVARLETASLAQLGHAAGRFFINGVTAQLCALQVHAERRGSRAVVIHPASHLAVDEAGALERAGGLTSIRLGQHRPFDRAALETLTEPLAAVVVELPLRRAGYLLPGLDELRAISAWCREQAVPLHFDGARIWEAAAGYGLSVAELAGLADSVYVSFYKGLAGLGGALVAGPEDFVAALDVWKTRYGGNLYTAYPYAIAALDGLAERGPRLPEFVARARMLAAAIGDLPGLLLQPSLPHTNAFQVWLAGTPADLTERHRQFAAATGQWLFDRFIDAPLDGYALTEIEIGPTSDGFTIEDAAAAIRRFMTTVD
ncbi:beta-eliminating lyase-related protein [Salinisphaera sp. SPP-AMP-43]|uniref:threonine aldolase family protein n=1 Tax=Salinisphaera sp. SPP-AMP-43 TaxID=3121288 RepID=UPI003C6E2685